MTTSIATPPKLQFFDSNGVPLSGGKLYSYAAGTTTPLATYTSSSGGTANTNPIILDSRGEANVWLNGVSYKLKLTSSTDVEIWTVDNLNGADQATLATLAASSGSSLIGYTEGAAGAVATTVQTKLREIVSVKDFGAKGDGTTDDTAAINAALTASDVVYFPIGTYMTDGSHNIKGKTLKGAGKESSIVKLRGTNTNASLFINGGSISTSWGTGGGFLMRDLGLKGNWDGSTTNSETDVSVIGGLIKWWAGAYIYLQDCNLSNCFGFGFFCYRMGYSTLRENHIYTNAKNGVHVQGVSASSAITSSRIVDCSINSCRGTGDTGGKGIFISSGFSFDVNSCTIEDVDIGIYVKNGDNRSLTFTQNHIESITTACIYIAGGGLSFMYFQNILATQPGLVQDNASASAYSSFGNFGLTSQWQLPYLSSAGSTVLVNNATPSTTLNSISLTAGTWTITGTWNGATSVGVGTASARQAYALNTSAALPAYNRNDAAMVRGDCTSTTNTIDGIMAGTLTLTVTVSATTTYYLYGGFTSISSTLVGALWGTMDAVKVAGVYQ